MLASILITNYNYGRYLRAAIDSALAQTHPDVEVIVVDDGSTDGSPALIASYGDRVISLVRENHGYVPSLNAAFDLSRGEIICLLDADDIFEPTKVEEVVDAAKRVPDAYLIHHQMRIIDSAGKLMYAPFPRHVVDGDIRRSARRAGGWFPHALTSALSFRRVYAERMFPLPEGHSVRLDDSAHPLSVCPDTYLADTASLLAPVAGIKSPLTRYRVHDKNMTLQSNVAEAAIRYEAEANAVAEVVRTTFGQTPALCLDGHVEYHLRLCAARRISRSQTAIRIMRSSSLPVALRVRETVRMAANRGSSRR